jgi:hypothetical protein
MTRAVRFTRNPRSAATAARAAHRTSTAGTVPRGPHAWGGVSRRARKVERNTVVENGTQRVPCS